MQPANLTDGAVEMLSIGEWNSDEFKPVLQIVDVRLVNTHNQNERYRLVISDGVYQQQGMLATQKNDLIRSKRIQKGSIIKMKEFVRNIIQTRVIIIIIDLDILLETCDQIGDPKHYIRNDGSITPSVPRPAAPLQHLANQFSGLSVNPQSYASVSAIPGSTRRPNMAGGMQSPETNRSSDYNTSGAPLCPKVESGPVISRAPMNYARPPQPCYQLPPPMYSNRGPIAMNEAPKVPKDCPFWQSKLVE